MAFPNENGNRYNMHYTADEAQMVDKAKRVHRETTESANRALKVITSDDELCTSKYTTRIRDDLQRKLLQDGGCGQGFLIVGPSHLPVRPYSMKRDSNVD